MTTARRRLTLKDKLEIMICGVACATCGSVFDRGYRISKKRAANPQFCCLDCRNEHTRKRSEQGVRDRFWSKVDRRGPEECWHWQAAKNKSGYGWFNWYGRKTQIASRLAYWDAKGDPGDLIVCHTCDNPSCCNPAHLWAGTDNDNMSDAAAKGRIRVPSLKGEKHPMAKLSASEAQAIRQSQEKSGVLAKKYGVSRVQINNIRKGHQWRCP